MAQPGTDQHESGVAIRETAHHTGTATDLPVQPLNDIVGADVSPVFTGKIAVGKDLLNVDICFLVQLTDGEGRDLAAPQSLSDVRHTPDGRTRQVHLNESIFHATLPAAIAFNDGGLKRNPLELRYLESDIPGSGGKVAAVVAAAVALALLISLVPGSLGQFLRFGRSL